MKQVTYTVGLTRLLVTLVLCAGAGATAPAQTRPSLGQQIAVMKIIIPDLKSIGVIGSGIGEKEIQDITRAGLGQGVQIVIGLPKDARDISSIYKKMVTEKKVQMIWITHADDEMMLGVGFEFLRSTTLPDKIGLCVPTTNLIGSGALCSVQIENGKVTAYINQKIAAVLGVAVPSVEDSPIRYVSR